MRKVTAAAHMARELYPAGATIPIIPGRGAHSVDGVARIRTAVESFLRGEGIEYRLENAGGMVVASLC